MKRKLFWSLSLAAMTLSFGAKAQLEEQPRNPQPGKCYVKCVTPDEFTTKEERILVRPAYKKIEIVPAEYKWVEERVEVKPASKRIVAYPAKFETYTETFNAEDGYNKLRVIPATFGDDQYRIVTAEKSARWEYKTNVPCVDNKKDCKILCYVETPEEYKYVPIKTLKTDATTASSPVAGKKQTVTRQRLVKDAYTEEIVVPAEYKTIKIKTLVKDETTRVVDVPAEYKTVTNRVLVKRGGVTVWEEVDCNLTNYNALPILYNLNSAALTPQAKRIIDENLLKLMQAKPNVKVEIASHTDSRGSDESNMDLSQRRAQSVVDYLVSKGINRSRLIAQGYGETRLKNRCANGVQCSEEEHHQNRRTEFRVVGE